jgi:hypothetical protein
LTDPTLAFASCASYPRTFFGAESSEVSAVGPSVVAVAVTNIPGLTFRMDLKGKVVMMPSPSLSVTSVSPMKVLPSSLVPLGLE